MVELISNKKYTIMFSKSNITAADSICQTISLKNLIVSNESKNLYDYDSKKTSLSHYHRVFQKLVSQIQFLLPNYLITNLSLLTGFCVSTLQKV